MQPLDEVEPRINRCAVHQRCAYIGGEQPRARTGYGPVDRVEQAALALPALCLGQFQALARRGVDRHRFGRASDAR